MLPPSPAESNTAPIGLVLPGTRVTCVVSLMDRVLCDLILTYSDRELSLLLLALSPFPLPRVISTVLPLPGSVSTVIAGAIPVPFSRRAWTLLSPMMGPRAPVKIRYTMNPKRISSFFADSMVRVVPRPLVLFLQLRHLRWRHHQSHRQCFFLDFWCRHDRESHQRPDQGPAAQFYCCALRTGRRVDC